MPRRSIWRLELACGHIAFALSGDPHHTGRGYFCHACDTHERIEDSKASTFKVGRGRGAGRRQPVCMNDYDAITN